MTDLAARAAPSGWLRAARFGSLAGIVGLGVAAFLPTVEQMRPEDTPVQMLLDPLSGRGQGLWMFFVAYVFPPILLALWCPGLFIRRQWLRSTFGIVLAASTSRDEKETGILTFIFGFWLSLASSTLIAAGGTLETILLWRAEKTP